MKEGSSGGEGGFEPAQEVESTGSEGLGEAEGGKGQGEA